MDSRLAYRLQTQSDTPSGALAGTGPQLAPGVQRLLQVAETASWAAMVLGLGTAGVVLVHSYLLGG